MTDPSETGKTNPYMPVPATIREIRSETNDTRTYFLTLGDSSRGYPWFRPGQFNMISIPGLGEAPISFSSPPNPDGTFTHTVRAVGNVTKALARMKRGDQVWIRGPFGNGWPLEAAVGTKILVVAGGLGLAPLRPIILNTIENGTGSNLTILYGARDPGQMLYRAEMEEWRDKGMELRLTVDEVPKSQRWEHKIGVVTGLLDEFKPRDDTVVFLCGPEIMMRFTIKRLIELGWDIRRTWLSIERRMECGIATCGRCQVDSVYVCKDGPVFNASTAARLIGVSI